MNGEKCVRKVCQKSVSVEVGQWMETPVFWASVNGETKNREFKNREVSNVNAPIDVLKISIVWLPRVKCLLLLWKTKTACIKKSIHYVTLQCYNPGEATQRNSSLHQSRLLIQKKQILKMTLPQNNGSRIKTSSSKSLILVSFCWIFFLPINILIHLI